MSPSRLRRVAV